MSYLFLELMYPEIHSTKTFMGEQQKFYKALIFLKLIAV